MTFTPGDANRPNHPYYQSRYHVAQAKRDQNKDNFDETAEFHPDMPPVPPEE